MVAALREQILSAKIQHAPETIRRRKNAATTIGYGLKLLDAYYFTKFFKAKCEKSRKIAETICSEFSLNEEQNRAFRIITNHAADDLAPPLRMYLGGVGGTGKSQVIKALVSFFRKTW